MNVQFQAVAVISGLLASLLLSGCATEAFRAAESACAPEAMRAFPVDNALALVTRQQPIDVPTGRLHCTTTSQSGNRSRSICQQEMRTEFIPYQTTELVDRNASRRSAAINACARDACVQRFGNPACKEG
jgi:hypothetical protein